MLLKLIADVPRHGYDLIREIEAHTGGAYAPSPGIIYPTLTLLDEMGQIEGVSEGTKKQFAITDSGRTELVNKAEVVAALIARLDKLGTAQDKTDTGPVRRAMGNLREVLSDCAARADVSPETMHNIAAILDEAAQRIERV